MYSSAWVEVAASQDASFQAGVVSQPFQKRDIGKFTACRLGLLQLIGARIKPIDDPIFADRLGEVPEKLSAATADIDDAVTGAESQIFQN